jgi:peptidyl-prolyl cis-trans isomerase A (cyclophilin A)
MMKKKAIIAGALMGLCAITILIAAQKHPAPGSATRQAAGASLLNPASLNQKAPDVYRVKFVTTKGDFIVLVTRAWAPLGADRFYNLIKHDFYTDASFFRVIPGFVAQFGISARPEVSKVWGHATIPDDPVHESNVRGTLSFATAGPNTRTTQIFINLADNVALDRMGFAPFGKVVEGMNVVDRLYSGYGEGAPQGRGPDQGRITREGKAYLDKNFPLLDKIKQALILPAPSAAATPSSRATKEKP